MPAGAPQGNQNAAKSKQWTAAINRALDLWTESRFEGKQALDKLAEKLLESAFEGDLGALKELGDRLEGKPTTVIGGDEERPLIIQTNERPKLDKQEWLEKHNVIELEAK